MQPSVLINCMLINKFGTNNDASWMKQDEEEDDDKDGDEDEDKGSFLTSKEPFRMITRLI